MICTHSTMKTSCEVLPMPPLVLTSLHTMLLPPIPREFLFRPGIVTPRLVGSQTRGRLRDTRTVLTRKGILHGVDKNGWVKTLQQIDSSGAKVDRGGNGKVSIQPVTQILAGGNKKASRLGGTRICHTLKGIDTCHNPSALIGIRLGQQLLGTLNAANGKVRTRRSGTATTAVLERTGCIPPPRIDLKMATWTDAATKRIDEMRTLKTAISGRIRGGAASIGTEDKNGVGIQLAPLNLPCFAGHSKYDLL